MGRPAGERARIKSGVRVIVFLEDKWDLGCPDVPKRGQMGFSKKRTKEDKNCPVSGHRDLLNVCMLKFDIFIRENCVRTLNMSKFSPAALQQPIKIYF